MDGRFAAAADAERSEDEFINFKETTNSIEISIKWVGNIGYNSG